ncbi:hypothetical protein FSP39_025118 [Pinctada imbricata]|uniref:B box-type domain-containing protein n=1 Tax=Pinctada imbricata TaxID=66713 RepID=A0AA89BRW0_PINIB|nr:hypothetical protein FSP39_025118 [Pinctada imbricata]
MAFSKSVNIAHAQRAVPCDVCEDEVPGEYYCIECKHTLCPPCEKLHKKFTKGHNVVLRSQIGDIHTTILTCADHGEQASCLCEKCDIPVCIKCVTGKHTGHTMSDLADAVEKEKKLLQDDIEALQRDLSTMKKKRGKIRMEKENYKKKIEKILKNMRDENHAAIEKLQRLHKERVYEITNIQDSDLAIFDVTEEEMKSKIISHEKRISEYEDTIAKNSLPALRNVTKGKPSMLEIKTKFKLPDPPLFVPGDLQSIVENMGKLHISPSPLMAKPLKLVSTTMVSKFHCQLQGNPRICITKDGDIWLGGYESRELVMVDIKGQVLRRRTIQNRPYSLAVMDCGDVIISPHSDDSRSVSI